MPKRGPPRRRPSVRRRATSVPLDPADQGADAAPAPRSRAAAASLREIDWHEFERLALALAKQAKSFAPTAVVGVARGGVFVGGTVASALGAEFFPVRISRRSRDHGQLDSPRVFGSMPKELKRARVLIVDDVAASGATLTLARSLAKKAGASAIETAALSVRRRGFRPDYFALSTDALLVFPWDYDLQSA